MVRLQQCIRQVVSCVLVAAACQLAAQQFRADDPLQKVPEVASAQSAGEQSINPLYDFLQHSAKYKTPLPTPSLGVNTLGEVPDSSWYTTRPTMTLQQLRQGARTHGAPQAPYVVTAAKTEGVTPGFRIKDGRGLTYFVKVDPPQNPEMGSGADVVAPLFLYAAGYNVPENYLLLTRRTEFRLSPKATVTSVTGKKRPMTQAQLEAILDAVPVQPDGQLRLMASLALPGRIIGPFRYEYTRSDDPNDLIPHDQRRDLRGLAVLFAWLNHTDAKGDNSLDTVEGKGADARIVHHLLDFGDSFGSDSDIAKDPRHGQEFWLPTSHEQARRAATFGVAPTAWEKAHYVSGLPALGNFTASGFDPLTWKPNYPNPAFLEVTPADGYWGAKRVLAFSDADIRAILGEGKFTDPRVADAMANVLIARRDLIGKAWLSRVAPLEEFTLAGDRLAYVDLSEKYQLLPSRVYHYAWFTLPSGSIESALPIDGPSSLVPPSSLLSEGEGSLIGCSITDASDVHRKVTVVFRRSSGKWETVGIDRSSS